MEHQIISSEIITGEPQTRFDVVHRVLDDAIAAHAFPGCAFGVLTESRVALQGARGHLTYDEDAPAVTPETVYDLASLTKVVATTAQAMLLHQRGVLDLDAPLGEFLPGFVVGREKGDLARHVKLRHLLAHNSGLPGYVEFFRTATTPAALFRACLELPLEADPGARAEYSDPGFILLGKALEVCTGEYLAPWVRHEIFNPIGLNNTGFCPPPSARPAIPPTEEDTPLRRRRIQGEVQDENAWLLKGAAGHAGLFSNIPNLLRFAAEILKASSGAAQASDHSGLFTQATVELFAQRQGPEGSSRALGWDTPSSNSSSGHHFSMRSIGHLGYSGCSLWIDLEARVAVALLTNRTWPDRQATTAQLIREVRPAFHDALREAL
ncbi:MAG: serine hydrolase domain-containing protein [Terracidiphilus sp.]|jgi:CubicO group peptidase (beta-lactamase class C family)